MSSAITQALHRLGEAKLPFAALALALYLVSLWVGAVRWRRLLQAMGCRVRVMRLTCIAGLAGLPQATVPVGTVAGCPVGLSFIGWAGGDEALLDLAVTLSRYCGIERA